MSIVHMSWNVQNFGQGTPYYTSLKGANSVLLAEFIARIVLRYHVKVLTLMEVTPTAQPHLDSVCLALNALTTEENDWCYDYVAGSLTVGPGAAAPNSAATTWYSGWGSPRQEGYAVFWMNDDPDFTMLRAEEDMSFGTRSAVNYDAVYLPGHAVSLSRYGRDFAPVGTRATWMRPTANFNPGGVLTMADFPPAYYPGVSTLTNDRHFDYTVARRPAYALISRTKGATPPEKILALSAYHAPSRNAKAQIGTYFAGMAIEHYVLKTPDANKRPTGALFAPNAFIASGDYNLHASTAANWNRFFYSFSNAFNATFAPARNVPGGSPAGGAAGTPVSTQLAPIRTTVQLDQFVGGQFTGAPIMGGAVANYQFSTIDNLFHRALPTPGTIQVVDLLTDVMTVDPNIMAGIQAYFPAMLALNPGANAVTGPVNALGNPQFNFFTNWTNFLVDMNNGVFTTARSAAEFVRSFVSDHMPMVVAFD